MAISYCKLHKRLFDKKKNLWATWSQEYVSLFEHFCDLLDTANVPYFDYKVIETPCDLCKQIAQEAVDEHTEPPQ